MRQGMEILRKIVVTLCCLITCVLSVAVITHFNDIEKIVKTVVLIEQKYIEKTDADTLTNGAIKGMLESLGDKYTTYIDEEQMTGFMQQVSGDVYGIGVYVSEDENGNFVIVSPIEEGPAKVAGIQAGDILRAVNGTRVDTLTLDEAIAMMRGNADEMVEVTIERDQQEKTFMVKRYKIGNTKTVTGKRLEENSQIAYLRIREFSLHTATEFADEVNTLVKQGFQGMILDLRDNGGGEVNAAVEVARIFVPSGPIVHVVSADGKIDTKNATEAQLKMPLVVLVNENTASASEILAGALKDSGVATLVGTQTFGKGLVQGVYLYRDGTAMKITEAKYLTPNQNDIHGVGIKPDVIIKASENTSEDVQLKKAIAVLEEKMMG